MLGWISLPSPFPFIPVSHYACHVPILYLARVSRRILSELTSGGGDAQKEGVEFFIRVVCTCDEREIGGSSRGASECTELGYANRLIVGRGLGMQECTEFSDEGQPVCTRMSRVLHPRATHA
jgi:hypothetical protein